MNQVIMARSTHNRGVTLLELSIVIVILGLIVGGIMAGQAIIRGGEVKSIGDEVTKHRIAVNVFLDKYMALPGDMVNATTFWGSLDGTAACANMPSTGVTTCNGNGDRLIENSTYSQERYRFWQHLANAGLIQGKYTGISGPGHASNDAVPGVNVPEGKIPGSGMMASYMPLMTGSLYYFDGTYGNNYFLVGKDGGASSSTQDALLSPQELWNVDTKLDDGKPGRGIITTWKGGYTGNSGGINCSTDPDPLIAQYNSSEGRVACAFSLHLNFR